MSSPRLSVDGRSLAILFGASEFPRYPEWSRESFANSAAAIQEYLLDPVGLGLQPEDLLNLFDSAGEPSQQLAEIESFLSERVLDLIGAEPANLIVYYVGHGCFSPDKHHCFAVRGTRPYPLGGSALRGSDLAEVVRQGAANLRRFLFIDCCFAAALFSEFQASSPGSVFEAQLDEELPGSGTALLCASSRDQPALAPQHWRYTMFGGALVEALRQGDRRLSARMSLRDLETLCRSIIRKNSPGSFTRPELHVPRAEDGDIANLKLFPNPAWATEQARRELEAQAEVLAAAQQRRAERQNIQAAAEEAERLRREEVEREAKEAERNCQEAATKAAAEEAERLRRKEVEREAREAERNRREAATKAAAEEVERLRQEELVRKRQGQSKDKSDDLVALGKLRYTQIAITFCVGLIGSFYAGRYLARWLWVQHTQTDPRNEPYIGIAAYLACVAIYTAVTGIIPLSLVWGMRVKWLAFVWWPLYLYGFFQSGLPLIQQPPLYVGIAGCIALYGTILIGPPRDFYK